MTQFVSMVGQSSFAAALLVALSRQGWEALVPASAGGLPSYGDDARCVALLPSTYAGLGRLHSMRRDACWRGPAVLLSWVPRDLLMEMPHAAIIAERGHELVELPARLQDIVTAMAGQSPLTEEERQQIAREHCDPVAVGAGAAQQTLQCLQDGCTSSARRRLRHLAAFANAEWPGYLRRTFEATTAAADGDVAAALPLLEWLREEGIGTTAAYHALSRLLSSGSGESLRHIFERQALALDGFVANDGLYMETSQRLAANPWWHEIGSITEVVTSSLCRLRGFGFSPPGGMEASMETIRRAASRLGRVAPQLTGSEAGNTRPRGVGALQDIAMDALATLGLAKAALADIEQRVREFRVEH